MNSRRTFLYQSAAAAALLSAPWIARSQGVAPVKVGVLHPVTGALAYSGQQCRLGALMAIDDINQAGGIKSLGGRSWRPCWAMRSRVRRRGRLKWRK